MDKEIQNPSLLLSLWLYLKKPYYDVNSVKFGFLRKFFDILKLWSLGIVVALVAAFFSSVFMDTTGLDDSQNLLEDFFDNSSVLVIVIIVFFWGPITEELTFRLFLRYSPFKLGFFLSFFLLLCSEILVSFSGYFSEMLNNYIEKLGILYFFSLIISLLFILGLIFSWLISISKQTERIDGFYRKFFPYIFYSSSLTFAFVHFYNYENYRDLWFALPFLIAPQLLLGFILGYIRMFYGFGWAIFFHSFHNGLASLPPILFSQVSDSSMELIANTSSAEPLAVPLSEKIFYISGMIFTLMIFLLVLIFFFILLKNHFKYLKQKNGIKNKN